MAAEAYFIVHVHPDGRKEVVKVEHWQITLDRDVMHSFWGEVAPGPMRISLQGYVGQGVSFDPSDPSVFDEPPAAIEAPLRELGL